ncbi:MAG: UvrD-helicase domain-containing protein [Mycoplasmatota bacterium]
MDLQTLNNKQLEAVKHVDGPLLVLAGAGSGKTRVLTTRIAYLISEIGISPKNILAITFTNKAAKEMRTRVFSLLNNLTNQIQISTFHSLGLLIIKENYQYLDKKANFTIIDSDDSLSTIKKILKEFNLDPKIYNPKAIRSKISGAKNELMTPDMYSNYVHNDFEEIVLRVYRRYNERLKENNSVDFDDLLMLPYILFKKNKDILKIYQDRYKYILVDEYQDTNEAQYKLVQLLSSKNKNICVVGDDYQSIYGFRGSNYKNILNFEKDYPNTLVILLEQNYRSTKNIINAANSVIKNNKHKKDKNLWTENEDGLKVKYKRVYNELEESSYIVSQILSLIENNVPLKEIAVLYRTNAQSRTLEDEILRNSIPYKVVGSFYFYNRKEIKDLISYLKLIHNQDDDISLLRVINVPKRGIGLKTIENITINARNKQISLFEAIDAKKELLFKNTIEELVILSKTSSLTELIDAILIKTGIREELEKEDTIESISRLENLEEFKSITKSFEEKNGIVSLDDFLNEITLFSDKEEYKDNDNVITLMTVHASKGLEFDNVFIAGLEEGIFPHLNSMNSDSELEEERRLCYVSITRAKNNLFITNCKRRLIFGNESYNPPSRFINEIDDSLLEKDEIVTKETKFKKEKNIDQDAVYTLGQKVYHEIFKDGVIVGIDKSVLTIAFAHPHGIKQLIKGHKSIKVI